MGEFDSYFSLSELLKQIHDYHAYFCIPGTRFKLEIVVLYWKVIEFISREKQNCLPTEF